MAELNNNYGRLVNKNYHSVVSSIRHLRKALYPIIFDLERSVNSLKHIHRRVLMNERKMTWKGRKMMCVCVYDDVCVCDECFFVCCFVA
jgi:hypothetical protein